MTQHPQAQGFVLATLLAGMAGLAWLALRPPRSCPACNCDCSSKRCAR